MESPCTVVQKDGGYTAELRWSSSHYDFMIVEGVTYYPETSEEGAVFTIPIPAPPCEIAVQADTTAMSTPHLIDYTLHFGAPFGDGAPEDDPEETAPPAAAADAGNAGNVGNADTAGSAAGQTAGTTAGSALPGLAVTGSMALAHAEGFSVDYYEDGLSLIDIPGSGRFLLIPEGGSVPEDLPADITILQQPLENIYMASSSDMDFFAACGALSSIRFTSLRKEDWALSSVREAMEQGQMLYVGKYSAPDYERLLSEGCGLAVENTMVFHSPEVRERLESFGIPVLVDRSSYEKTPRGRIEWIRLYGLLTGCSEEADNACRRVFEKFDALENTAPCGASVAYFYINTAGLAVIRRSDDYIPALIRTAGGTYAFPGTEAKEGAHSATLQLQLEAFYAGVKDADYLIYSTDIPGALSGLDELLSECPLLAGCRAVQSGHVYMTTEDLFQSVMEMGDFVTDLHDMMTQEDPDLVFLEKLE